MQLKSFLETYWIDICRVFLISNIFYHLIQTDVESISSFPDFFRQDLFFFQFIPYQSIDLVYLKRILFICLIFLIIGYKIYFVSVLSFFLSFLIFGYRYNFGFFHWADSMIPLSLLMLSIFPVSNLRINKKICNQNPHLPAYHVFSMRFVLIYMFFSSGISKLLHSGLYWFLSDNMKTRFLINESLFSGWFPEENSAIYLFIINNDFVLLICGIMAGFIEFISPIALFSNQFKYPIVCGLFILLVAFKVILRHDFLIYCWPLFFYFIVFDPKKEPSFKISKIWLLFKTLDIRK